eukprot:scaffold906_cov186-Alexandrium_tamarense.AAC.60
MNELDIPVEEGVWGVDDTGVLLLLLAGVTVFLAGVDGMPIVDGWGGGGGGSPAMTTNGGDGCAKKPLSLCSTSNEVPPAALTHSEEISWAVSTTTRFCMRVSTMLLYAVNSTDELRY